MKLFKYGLKLVCFFFNIVKGNIFEKESIANFTTSEVKCVEV